MNRRVTRLSAIVGTALVSTLAVAPAFAAAPVSQASAQSIDLKIAGNDVISQNTSAVNDGSTESVVKDNTLPSLVGLIPGNNAVSAAVGVQKAQANNDATSFACAGIAGPGGGGLVNVGNTECKIDGKALTLGLGNLDLDLTHLLGGEGVVSAALDQILGPVLQPLTGALAPVVSQLTDGLAGAGLNIGLSGGLSVVEATCKADASAATGRPAILDTAGNHKIPITLNLPNNTNVVVANVNVDVAPTPGGTDVVVHLDLLTQAVINAITDELSTVIQGQLADLSAQVKALILQPVQDQIVTVLVNNLKPLLQEISDKVLKVVVNDVTPGDGGRSVSVNTLKIEALGAIKEFTGSALISGTIGHVTCGPNRAPTVTPPTTPENPQNPEAPETPTVVASGVAGQGDHTARNILLATGALMLLAGSAGLVGFRRSLLNK